VAEVGYGADACDVVVVLAAAIVNADAVVAPVVVVFFIHILGYCDVLGLHP
jgi:hypothetical protein